MSCGMKSGENAKMAEQSNKTASGKHNSIVLQHFFVWDRLDR